MCDVNHEFNFLVGCPNSGGGSVSITPSVHPENVLRYAAGLKISDSARPDNARDNTADQVIENKRTVKSRWDF
jgi:hypothetical protein